MAEFWCVVSSKGGVGKTFVSSSFGVTLAKLKKRVLLIDYDFSGANLHTTMGVRSYQKSIQDFNLNMDDIKSLIIPSAFANVDLIAGFTMPQLNNELELLKVENLLSTLKKLDYDYIIFDLGPGATSSNFTLMSVMDRNFIVSSAEPASITKTEQFFLFLQKAHQPITNLNLVVNSCRSHQHKELAKCLSNKLKSHHQLVLQGTYSIPYDNAVWQSANMNSTAAKNVFALMPYAEVCTEFIKIGKHFIDRSELRVVS